MSRFSEKMNNINEFIPDVEKSRTDSFMNSQNIFNKNKMYVRTIQKHSKLILKLLDVQNITVQDLEYGKSDRIIAHYNQSKNQNYIFIVNKEKYIKSGKKIIVKDRIITDPVTFIKELQQILQVLNKSVV